MLYSSIFLKLVFCQKKSSVVNFRKVKSIYKSKHKHGAMKTRRMWGPAGSRSAEVTVGAGLAGKRVGTSFPSLNTGQRGGRVWRRYEAQRALSPLRCHSPPHPSSRRQWTLSVYVCSLLLGFREDWRKAWHRERANCKELGSGRDCWLSSLVASRSLLISCILPKEVSVTF